MFAFFHFHPFLIAWLYRNNDWLYGVIIYLFMLISILAIHYSPLYLRRPVAFLAYITGILIWLYVFKPTPGIEWFAPLFYLKLLLSQGLKEEP
ncbi:MAG: hypothetical protein ACLFQV_08410 [Vulcanimicrobiota bacterium]